MGHWTNSNHDICTWTGKDGLGIGKVYLKDKEYEVLGKDEKEETAYILDKKHGNFHFLPVLKPGKVIDDLNDYLSKVKDVQDKLHSKLSEKYNLSNGKGKGTGKIKEKRFPQVYVDNGLDNGFFRYVRVTDEQSGRLFTINFMRWYVENETINCVMGGIQFDSTEKDEKVNFAGSISYPKTSEGQDLKNLTSNKSIYFFNPSVSDIWKENENLVKEFEAFIEKVNELEKNKA